MEYPPRAALRLLTATICVLSLLVTTQGCNKETVSGVVARLSIEAEPTARQQALSEVPGAEAGLELGQVPLFGQSTGTFLIRNISIGRLEIQGLTLDSAFGGSVEVALLTAGGEIVQDFPLVLESQSIEGDSARLLVTFAPEGVTEEVTPVRGEAIVAIQTNAGEAGNDVVRAFVGGTGVWVGEPNLELAYNGLTYAIPEDCTGVGTDNACILPAFDFGFVPIGGSSSLPIQLLNNPTDPCMLPDIDGAPDCTPACVVTIDRGVRDLGLGFDPVDAGFALSGAANVPVGLAPADPRCAGGSILRGSVSLVTSFVAGDEETDQTGTMVIESNDPQATLIEVPLAAAVREGPEAVAELRDCSTFGPPCTNELRPLQNAFIDGSGSFDKKVTGQVTRYVWEVTETPAGTDPALLDLQCGTATANPANPRMCEGAGADQEQLSLWMPLVGDYEVCLTVYNELNIPSVIGDMSCVTLSALPSSRLHIQLIWDHPVTDHDLHVLYAGDGGVGGSPNPFNDTYDCFWRNCKPTECIPENNCTPSWWFDMLDQPFSGPNGRLDIDDTAGFGPENINVDDPQPGEYHVYVHYYGLVLPPEETPPNRVTVRIFVDGQLFNQATRVLEREQLWAVARIVWRNDGATTVESATPDVSGEVGSVQTLGFLPEGDGYSFGPAFP